MNTHVSVCINYYVRSMCATSTLYRLIAFLLPCPGMHCYGIAGDAGARQPKEHVWDNVVVRHLLLQTFAFPLATGHFCKRVIVPPAACKQWLVRKIP